jgi:hypothetical protein
MIQLEESFDLEGQRLRRMDEALLLRWGRAAAELSNQRKVFRLQAEAAREEWRRWWLRQGRWRTELRKTPRLGAVLGGVPNRSAAGPDPTSDALSEGRSRYCL